MCQCECCLDRLKLSEHVQEEEALAQALARHDAGQEEDGMGEQEEMQGYVDDDGRQDSLEQVSL